MRRWRRGLIGLLLSVLGWPLPLQAALFELHNGEVIVGELSAPLTVEAALGGVLTVPPQAVFSIEGERFACMDGTVLRGRVTAEAVAVNTGNGQVVQIPVAQLKAMRRGKDAVVVPSTHGSIFELHDGEVMVGELSTPLTLALSFGATVEVPARELATFAEGRFTLRDGSLLQGQLLQETLQVTTQFGILQVPRITLKRIRTAPGAVPSGALPVPPSPPRRPTPGNPASSDETVVNSIGMTFLLIPAGEFSMGSQEGDYDERPVHKVRISRSFYLGKYEVTQGQWQMVMGTKPSHFAGDPNLPVEQVSWEDVQAFVRTLNAKEGGPTYRLPTEAEWEHAARAGATSVYSFGDDAEQLGAYAWYGDNAGGRTHTVGKRRPNAWGLYDMHGNVWEWVQDWYGPYDVDPGMDPQGSAPGTYRVYRGGGWGTFAGNCRASDRNFEVPGEHLAGLGFRLLREIGSGHGAPNR